MNLTVSRWRNCPTQASIMVGRSGNGAVQEDWKRWQHAASL